MAAPLDTLLTIEQQEHLAALLAVCKAIQHGEVYIRIANGKERFIGMRVEEGLALGLDRSKIAELMMYLKR